MLLPYIFIVKYSDDTIHAKHIWNLKSQSKIHKKQHNKQEKYQLTTTPQNKASSFSNENTKTNSIMLPTTGS